MNLKNKAVLISASVLTASALVIASPALAHKGSSKSTTKATTRSVVASPSPTSTSIPTPPVFNGPGDRDGHHGKGHKPKGPKTEGARTPISQTVTVDVPVTGSYQLLVTEVKPANAPTPPPGAPVRPVHSFTVPVTGTGSQTVTLNLPHPGEYSVSLISVVSSQSIVVAPPVK